MTANKIQTDPLPPDQATLDAIRAALDPEADIPQGDYVSVLAPEAVERSGDLSFWAESGDLAELEAAARQAVDAAILEWRQALGAAIAPSELEAAVLALPGVVHAETAGLVYERCERDQFADVMVTTITGIMEAPDA